MVTLQKDEVSKTIPKAVIVQIQKDVKKGKRYASLRVWVGSTAFCAGIMMLVIAGLMIEESEWIWWISGFLGALLILAGFHFISTC